LIAVRRVSREEWEAELRHYGCSPAQGLTKLNSAEWWRYPWGGYPFTVPAAEDGYVLKQDLDDIIGDLLLLAEEHGFHLPDDD
jgi:hypothetical protein